MSDRNWLKVALDQGMNPTPDSGILRPRKFLNRHKKRAKWSTNHQERAAVNRSRSNDPRSNPTWHGIGHS